MLANLESEDDLPALQSGAASPPRGGNNNVQELEQTGRETLLDARQFIYTTSPHLTVEYRVETSWELFVKMFIKLAVYYAIFFFFIITQLAMFDLLLRFDHHRWPSSLNIH